MHRLVKSSRQAGQGQGSHRQKHFFDVPAGWPRRYNRLDFSGEGRRVNDASPAVMVFDYGR
jgi:hypothetical protein